MNLRPRIEDLQRLVESGYYKQAVMEAGSLLETLLKQLYADTVARLPPAEQNKVSAEAEKIGKGKRVPDFTLGQVAGLFRETRFFDRAEKALGRRLARLDAADYNFLIELRNQAAHGKDDPGEHEARLFAAQLPLFAREAGYWQQDAPADKPAATGGLRRWTDLVTLHRDVEFGALTEAVFAIDLGAIAARDPNAPPVYRDAEAFFGATHLTVDLLKLLEEVLASLAGQSGYNRVLKLRTPFGGGKSHTLATLFHAARNRRALDGIPEARDLADPGEVAVAVFDGEKFDARVGKEVEDGRTIRTMWGWLAWQIDPQYAFPLVEGHDHDRIAPGGDVIRQVLTAGARGRPVLLLLDEVLKYMERAGAVPVLDSTLRRQAMDFFQNLTVEVAGSAHAALVYSLQWSSREALENVALLQQIDHLADRVDQLREPVSGDEILPILQRRLLGSRIDEAAIREIALQYAQSVTNMRRAYAETTPERQRAEEEGLSLRDRIRKAYPFHPALIDIMKERWAAVDNFQRTRGALRFLASCLHSLHHSGGARPLLGPGDIPLRDIEVRVKMLKELGAQNDYDPVITADLEGPNARAKRIDEYLARDSPNLATLRPATRLATAILLCSFGGVRHQAQGSEEMLPPGATEEELMAACVGPDLDNITITAVLSELRKSCLYLHYENGRYCFKKEPSITKLIEDAEQEISREEMRGNGQGPVRERIRKLLDQNLAGHHDAHVWPPTSHAIPDEEPRFLVAYLPLDFAREAHTEQERLARELFLKYGDRPRQYRNGIGLAVPEKKQIEVLRRAVRYILSTERVEAKKHHLHLTREQLSQLAERRRTEESSAESSLRELYSAVWLPRGEGEELALEKIEKGGRPLKAVGIHERIAELLGSQGTPRVHGTLNPSKIVKRLKLGEPGAEPRLGVKTADVLYSFFSAIDPPRIQSAETLKAAIARGIAEGVFAYTSGPAPVLGSSGKFQTASEKVILARPVPEEEIDLDSGFLMLPSAVSEPPTLPTPTAIPEGSTPVPHSSGTSPDPTPSPNLPPQPRRTIDLSFSASREQVFKAFLAIANLAEKSDGGRITIQVRGSAAAGYDPLWLRNAVVEPLAEADIEPEGDL